MAFWSGEYLDTTKSASGEYRNCPYGDKRPRDDVFGVGSVNKMCVAFEFQNDKVVTSAADCSEEKYFVCRVLLLFLREINTILNCITKGH